MSRLPDLVRDSELETVFIESGIIHSFREIDEIGERFVRQELWEWDRILGCGGFGQVKLQRRIEEDSSLCTIRAVKIISKPQGPSPYLDYNRELEAIAKFSHDRYRRWFVKSFGWFQDLTSVFVAMEYCQHGDLQDYLKTHGSLSTSEVQKLARQMVEGLDQMHQNDFAHRDLKPGNILIKSMPPGRNWWVVLADFGISKRADENAGTTAIKGTTAFMAPELRGYLDEHKPRTVADFQAADMWALGEIIFQMLTGQDVFQNPMELSHYRLGQHQFPSYRLPDSVSRYGHEIVASLMALLPKSRITTVQCINHPWMAEHVAEGPTIPIRDLRTQLAHDASARWSKLSSFEGSVAESTERGVAIGYSKQISKPIAETGAKESAEMDAEESTQIRVQGSTQIHVQESTEIGVAIGYPTQISNLIAEEETPTPTPPHNTLDRTGWYFKNKIEAGKHRLLEIRFSPDSLRLAASTNDYAVRVWKFRDKSELAAIHTTKKKLTIRNFSYGLDDQLGTWASLEYGTQSVKLWDISSGELLSTLVTPFEWSLPHFAFNPHMAFSLDGTRVAVTREKEVYLFDTRSNYLAPKYRHDKVFQQDQAVHHIAFSNDGTFLASMGRSKFFVWACFSGTPQAQEDFTAVYYSEPSKEQKIIFSNNGRFLIVRAGATMFLYRRWYRTISKIVDVPPAEDMSFSPDDQQVAFLTHELKNRQYRPQVIIWNTATREIVQTIPLELDWALGAFPSTRLKISSRSLVLSPDGRWLAVTRGDTASAVWIYERKVKDSNYEMLDRLEPRY